MTTQPPLAERIAQLLRDMGGVAVLPDDDPRRAAWIGRKHDLLAQVQACDEARALDGGDA